MSTTAVSGLELVAQDLEGGKKCSCHPGCKCKAGACRCGGKNECGSVRKLADVLSKAKDAKGHGSDARGYRTSVTQPTIYGQRGTYHKVKVHHGRKTVASMEFVASPKSNIATISGVYVNKEHRGKGVGHLLYEAAKAHLAEHFPHVDQIEGDILHPAARHLREQHFGPVQEDEYGTHVSRLKKAAVAAREHQDVAFGGGRFRFWHEKPASGLTHVYSPDKTDPVGQVFHNPKDGTFHAYYGGGRRAPLGEFKSHDDAVAAVGRTHLTNPGVFRQRAKVYGTRGYAIAKGYWDEVKAKFRPDPPAPKAPTAAAPAAPRPNEARLPASAGQAHLHVANAAAAIHGHVMALRQLGKPKDAEGQMKVRQHLEGIRSSALAASKHAKLGMAANATPSIKPKASRIGDTALNDIHQHAQLVADHAMGAYHATNVANAGWEHKTQAANRYALAHASAQHIGRVASEQLKSYGSSRIKKEVTGMGTAREVLSKTGKGHRFTEHEDKIARHIIDGEVSRGKSKEEAERIAYATVNARKSGIRKAADIGKLADDLYDEADALLKQIAKRAPRSDKGGHHKHTVHVRPWTGKVHDLKDSQVIDHTVSVPGVYSVHAHDNQVIGTLREGKRGGVHAEHYSGADLGTHASLTEAARAVASHHFGMKKSADVVDVVIEKAKDALGHGSDARPGLAAGHGWRWEKGPGGNAEVARFTHASGKYGGMVMEGGEKSHQAITASRITHHDSLEAAKTAVENRVIGGAAKKSIRKLGDVLEKAKDAKGHGSDKHAFGARLFHSRSGKQYVLDEASKRKHENGRRLVADSSGKIIGQVLHTFHGNSNDESHFTVHGFHEGTGKHFEQEITLPAEAPSRARMAQAHLDIATKIAGHHEAHARADEALERMNRESKSPGKTRSVNVSTDPDMLAMLSGGAKVKKLADVIEKGDRGRPPKRQGGGEPGKIAYRSPMGYDVVHSEKQHGIPGGSVYEVHPTGRKQKLGEIHATPIGQMGAEGVVLKPHAIAGDGTNLGMHEGFDNAVHAIVSHHEAAEGAKRAEAKANDARKTASQAVSGSMNKPGGKPTPKPAKPTDGGPKPKKGAGKSEPGVKVAVHVTKLADALQKAAPRGVPGSTSVRGKVVTFHPVENGASKAAKYAAYHEGTHLGYVTHDEKNIANPHGSGKFTVSHPYDGNHRMMPPDTAAGFRSEHGSIKDAAHALFRMHGVAKADSK